jgi:EAL domain-containing protein (putative c-di-GMP-specific phosphodiesterase class I)
MHDVEHVAQILAELKGMGLRIAVDDFGTGYSSLGYLKRLPLDALKVDRSFIRDVPGDQDDVAITRAVVALAHSLRLTVVAEGVETEEQLRFVGEAGCELVQGFLTGRPVSAAVLVETFGIGRAECGPASSLRSATVVGSARPGHEPWSG